MKPVAKASLSIPARPDESQDPGLTSNLAQACSLKSARNTRIPLLAALCLATLPLAACNFVPVYGGGQGAAYANSGPIQINEIIAKASDRSASGRTGHFLRQELVRSIGQGVPGFSSGVLDVDLTQQIRRLAFAPDQAASRSDYVGRAVWTLRGPNGDILGTGTVEDRASFNFGDAAYADLAAQTAAQERLANLLARSIRTQMIVAAGKPVDPKTGKAVVPKDAAAPATPKP
jgi:hypothetical protein